MNAGPGCIRSTGEAQSAAISTVGALVKVSRENLALAVLWGAIAACALMTFLAPNLPAAEAGESHLTKIMAKLVRTAF